ncbi:hypothetical protein [Pseudomonas aeruginosa]|uniref:hypothetical protein n=1 Tax=Pseudomonas aeruginosa TaxID=287 RepID=UPI001FF3DA19|nr:hypothetical protein [Pseudomonas aeruginosa]MCX5482924.1 hypothetical protein [Pseudomonas aeruginosa]MCX5489037.1 hypothetical protein [Pseudomonas aeruginosa]HCW0556241.1 hypothetical protein [Pseudomonas aeruginosa]HCW0562875.1 hypothetical protein [Pseudomonas aeruginosa]HCW0952839.1 hypothetical protein [Pseudomonas aeruginosa]
MPSLTNEQLPALAAALIRLRGETLGRIAEVTGIRTANLSVWLRGKEQVISAKRLVGLLHHLGMEGGRLRSDVLHQWQDRGALDDSRLVLSLLQANNQPVWLFQDEQPGLIKTRFLLAGDVLIRMEIEPGVDQALDLATVVRVDRVITMPSALGGVPIDSLASARNVLLALAEQVAADVGDEELLEGLIYRLVETVGSSVSSVQGWHQLEQALRFAFNSGTQPGDIARVVDAHFRSSGNADMPPTE